MLRSVVIFLFLIIYIAFYIALYILTLYGWPYFDYLIFLSATLPLAIISWVAAYTIYNLFNVGRVSCPHEKAVLITGCSSGFGLELAKRLDRKGFNVFAGVRNLECAGAKDLQKHCSSRLKVVKIDVTKPEQVDDVLAQVKASGLPLYGLVNNAGMAQGLAIDWGEDVDQYRDHLEVNFFGVVRMTKAALPLLRKSQGRIINVGSYASRAVMPFMAAYCASKHAQRAFTNALRLELFRDNIQVIGIEPTFYRTPILDFDRMRANQTAYFKRTPEDIRDHYDRKMIHRIRNTDQITQMFTRQNVKEVIDNLVKAVTLRQPKVYYRCCGYLDLGLWLNSVLPEIIVDILMIFAGYYSIVFKISRVICKLTGKPIFPVVTTDEEIM